jgi:hemoglobin-like flavoprotein
MTPEQKRLVCDSFAQVVPSADAAAALFYKRLFELDPSLRLMFRGNMAEQRRKLMTMIAAAVKGLDRLDELVPAAEDLGRRHAGYGVKDEHYGTVGAALLWMLERRLGDAFTPAVRHAWTDCYGLLAGVMQRAGAAPGMVTAA